MRKITLIIVSIFVLNKKIIAEGTPQIMPNPAIDIRFQVYDNNDPARNFMTYGCPATSRLNIRVKNIGNERIHIGLRQNDGDVYMRVRDPLGTVVYGPVLVPASGAGFISTHAQAVAGPVLIAGSSGYNSLYFTPSLPGDYYIEFNPLDPNNYIAGTSNVKRLFDFFDVTVQNIPTNTAIKGRLWSNAWDFNCMSFTNPFEAKINIYAPDSVLTQIDFNGIQPFGFVILANNTGLTNTPSIVNDRRSANGNIQYPLYKLFLQIPDTSIFVPSRVVPRLVGAPNISGCSSSFWNINLNSTHNAITEIYFNLNGVPGYQTGTADVFFNNRLSVGNNQIPWDGNNGLGVALANGTPIDMFIKYFAGLSHLPLFDCENHPNGYKINVIAPPAGNPSMFWDDSNVGGSNNLGFGCVNNCHSWTGDFGNNRTINTWWVTHYSDVNVTTTKYNKCQPTANSDYRITTMNAAVTISVTANDTDPAGYPLTVSITTPPITGTAIVVGNQIQFTPAVGFSGSVTIVYQVCNSNTPPPVLCDTALVTIIVDCDDDGITGSLETPGDADGDGVSNSCDLDSDNDGIRDNIEGYTDFDGDGIPNAIDLDSDDDGIPDAIEANAGVVPSGYNATTGRIEGADMDGDGLLNILDNAPSTAYGAGSTSLLLNPNTDGDARANFLDKDSDNDGVMDAVECGGADANRDGVIDAFIDANGDGIRDALLTTPLVIGNIDGARVDYLDCDADGDGISDNREAQTTAAFTAASTVLADADGDGIIDAYDGGQAIVPVDTDSDGIADFRDTDSDNDGILDSIEGNDANSNGVADSTPTGTDADGDGIDNIFDPNAGFSANSNVPCQNFDGDAQRDWRDSDDDNDGVPTVMETGDNIPANGIPDYLETSNCGNHFLSQSSFATSVFSNAGVTTANNALNTANGTVAILDNNGDNFALNFGSAYPTGAVIRILARRQNGGGNSGGNGLVISQSTNGTTFSNPATILDATFTTGFVTYTYTTNIVNVQYVRLARTGNRDIEVDAVSITQCVPDQDNDGVPNTTDLDEDNDGLSDAQEGATDSDGDGLINSLDLDSDNDGIPDAIEANAGVLPANMGTNGQFSVAYVKANDSNTNGWVNIYDNLSSGINLQDQDFDGDGIPNRRDLDSDSDGIRDAVEANNGSLPANMNNLGQYPAVFAIANDTDGDGLVNTFDSNNGGVAILNPDSDADGGKDFLDLDSDGDTLLDGFEANNGAPPTGMNASGQYPPAYVTANDPNGNGLVNALETTPLPNPDADNNSKPDYLDRCLLSVANGNWNSASTWGGSVPTCGQCATVAHTVTVVGSSNVSNVSIIAGGVLSNPSGTLNVCGNILVSGGVATAGCNSKTVFSGTANQIIKGDWQFGTLEINNPSGVTTQTVTNITVLKALVLTQGAFNFSNAASFVLKSDNVCGTAYVSGNGSGTLVGNTTLEKYADGCGGYLSIGAPCATNLNGIQGLYYQGFAGTYYPSYWCNTYGYDESQAGVADVGYVQPTNVTNALVKGKGVICYMWDYIFPQTIKVTGAMDISNFNFPITYNASAAGNLHDGFNLLANPYPAPIDWSSAGGWTKVGCCNAIYTYNRCGNQYSAYVAGISVNGGTNVISPLQGFWIKAHNNTASIQINRNAIVGTQQPLYRTSNTPAPLISVLKAKIENAGYADELAIAFGDTALSNGLGSWYGATKMLSNTPYYPSFASLQVMPYDTFLMSINMMPELKTNKIVQLKTNTRLTGIYDLTFTGLNTFDKNVCLFLEDSVTGTFHDLRQDSTISIALDSINYMSNRFKIHFNAPPTVQILKSACANSNNGMVAVSSPYPNSTFTWKDVIGKIIKQSNFSSVNTDSLENVNPGVYFLQISNNSGSASTCSSASMDIVIPVSVDSIDAAFTVSNPSFCNSNDGSIQTTISSVNSPYTYKWSNGATTPSVTVGDGTYQLMVADAAGCKATRFISVNGPVVNYANFSIDNDTLVWPNALVNLTNTSYASTSYVWDFGDGTQSSNINETHQFTSPGTYTISLIAISVQCTDTLKKVLSIITTTDIKNNDVFSFLQLSPNPNSGDFNLKYNHNGEKHSIEIIDMLGRVAYTEIVSDNLQTKVYNKLLKAKYMTNGIYILKITHNNFTKEVKLVIEK